MSAPSDPGPALELQGVSVQYAGRTALHAVDLTIGRGEFVALTGPNGSGKTTLIKAALGLLPTSAGEVRLFGDPLGGLSIPERARRSAWVPQSEDPRDDVRLYDYVLYGRYARHSALDGETLADRRLAERVLADVGLSDRAEDGIRSISGGERQRAILARALAQEAPLLLLDEPTTHLDIAHQLELLERVRRLSRANSVTVLAALHDLNLAARYADRIVVLARGRRVADGRPVEVLSEELLLRVWGVVADLRPDPRTGLPYLIPHRLVADRTPPAGATGGTVHVIGGGGAAAPILRALVDGGFRVTTGALNLLDSDAEAAEALGVPAALEAPFAPLGDEVRARHRELLQAAGTIVIAPVAFGPSNLANLQDVEEFAGERAVYLVGAGSIQERDFTGGHAVELVEALRRAGAVDVVDGAGLTAALAEPAVARRPPRSAPEGDRTDGDRRSVDHGELAEEPR
ncbi:MAG TPA: ABC transporter ATP-binding protein [Thermoplasmata archaeon]|nr:ABC transporter ATP-binding protein [Thermoplasmata archaeon]